MSTYRLRATGSLPGELFIFGLHATGAGGASTDALTAWVAALSLMWSDVTDGLDAIYTPDVSIDVADAAELDAGTGRQITRVQTALPLPGTASGEMLPHEVSVAVSTRTAFATKAGRGRFYLPPPAVSTVDGGRLSTSARDRIANAAAILINSLQGAAFEPVIHHPDQTTTVINEVDVGDVFDVQMRRRNKLFEARATVGV